MRILMVNHEFTVTGSSTAFFRLAEYLQSQRHEITVFPINPVDGPMKKRFLDARLLIQNQIETQNFDLCIGNTICAADIILQLARALPTIWFVNEAEVALRILLESPQLIRAFATATAVIYNMPFQHGVFKSFTYNLDQTKFYTCSFGVDINFNDITRERVPAKHTQIRAVQVGTIEPRKRPSDFLQAAERSGLDIEAVVIGKFYDLDEATRELVAKRPDKFKLLQELSDSELLAWVETADMFCLASSSETQALSVYEAALLSRPLILTDLPCYDNIYKHGVNCLMYPVGHIELLSLFMQVMAASPGLRQQLGSVARQSAAQYSNAKFFTKFDTIMAEVMYGWQQRIAAKA